MILTPPMMQADHTVVHVWKTPGSEAQRWTGFEVAGLDRTEGDEDLAPPSGAARREQTTLDEHDASQVKRPTAATGDEASSTLVIQGAPAHSGRAPLSPEAVSILRAKYLGAFLRTLESMQPYARTPHVARYAGEMVDAANAYADRAPDDPIVEVVLAVYPALVDENHWADWSAQQLRDLHSILEHLVTRPSVTPDMVDKAITKIEEQVAIDTLPFEIDPHDIT